MRHIVYVQEINKESGRFTLPNATMSKLRRDLALGYVEGIEVRVKGSNE